MGLTQSHHRTHFSQRDTANPKTFYLVMGGPKIKFIKPPAINGPLIFNVKTETDSGPEKVEKAETIRNYFRVSHKNGGIKMKPLTSKNQFEKDGYELSFIIDGTPGMSCQVDVFLGAKVELKKGVGLSITDARTGKQAKKTQPHHICQQAGILADAGGLEFTCDEPIYLNQLLEPKLPASVPKWSAPNLLLDGAAAPPPPPPPKPEDSYVPVVVQVSYMVDVALREDSDAEFGREDSTAIGDDGGGSFRSPTTRFGDGSVFNTFSPATNNGSASSSGTKLKSGGRGGGSGGAATTSVGRGGMLKAQSFVTCLVFEPKKMMQKAKDNHSNKPAAPTNKRRVNPAAHPSISVTQTRNFLQLDGEVYEMNDIFDAAEGAVTVPSTKDKGGGGASATGEDGGGAEQAEEEEDDEANLCVVCITEPKNTVVLPCRHLSLCAECASTIKHMKGTCPVCRGPIEKMMAMS